MEATPDERRLREIQDKIEALLAVSPRDYTYQIRYDGLVTLEAILHQRVKRRSAAAA
jgi:hypothetical protein